MKKIHTIKMMGIIVYTRRTISRSIGRRKTLLSLEVWKAICERWPRHVICHGCCKSSKITRPLGPPQQKFIPIKSMTTWTTLQELSIQCRLFKNMNVVVEFDVVVYRQVLHFPNCYNQMLCTVFAKLQVAMSTHSSSLNFCKSKERKY